MAIFILTDRSFLLNLFYPGSFLFGTHEDALAFARTYSESNVVLFFSVMGNNGARVLMAGCLSSQLVKRNKKGFSKMGGGHAPRLYSDGSPSSDAAWCCGAKRARLF